MPSAQIIQASNNKNPRTIQTNPFRSRVSSSPSFSFYSTTKSTALFEAIPEPGPCPECNDENGYWDGSTNFVCIACGHEWLVASQNENGDNGDDDSDDTIRDSNGNILESGDTVVLTKELGKGLKKGLKVTRIRVGDYGDDHDVQANIPGLGTFNLKSQFLKKTK
jgi:protein PhnA